MRAHLIPALILLLPSSGGCLAQIANQQAKSPRTVADTTAAALAAVLTHRVNVWGPQGTFEICLGREVDVPDVATHLQRTVGEQVLAALTVARTCTADLRATDAAFWPHSRLERVSRFADSTIVVGRTWLNARTSYEFRATVNTSFGISVRSVWLSGLRFSEATTKQVGQ